MLKLNCGRSLEDHCKLVNYLQAEKAKVEYKLPVLQSRSFLYLIGYVDVRDINL